MTKWWEGQSPTVRQELSASKAASVLTIGDPQGLVTVSELGT